MQRVGVCSLIGELISYMLCSMAKKYENKQTKKPLPGWSKNISHIRSLSCFWNSPEAAHCPWNNTPNAELGLQASDWSDISLLHWLNFLPSSFSFVTLLPTTHFNPANSTFIHVQFLEYIDIFLDVANDQKHSPVSLSIKNTGSHNREYWGGSVSGMARSRIRWCPQDPGCPCLSLSLQFQLCFLQLISQRSFSP